MMIDVYIAPLLYQMQIESFFLHLNYIPITFKLWYEASLQVLNI